MGAVARVMEMTVEGSLARAMVEERMVVAEMAGGEMAQAAAEMVVAECMEEVRTAVAGMLVVEQLVEAVRAVDALALEVAAQKALANKALGGTMAEVTPVVGWVV